MTIHSSNKVLWIVTVFLNQTLNQRWFALLIAKRLFSELLLFATGLTCKTKSFCNEKSEKRKTCLIYFKVLSTISLYFNLKKILCLITNISFRLDIANRFYPYSPRQLDNCILEIVHHVTVPGEKRVNEP